MIARRSLLRLLGLAAVAPALPAIAAPTLPPEPPLLKAQAASNYLAGMFEGELMADVQMADGLMYNATARGLSHAGVMVLHFTAPVTGVMTSLSFRRGENTLCSYGSIRYRAVTCGDEIAVEARLA